MSGDRRSSGITHAVPGLNRAIGTSTDKTAIRLHCEAGYGAIASVDRVTDWIADGIPKADSPIGATADESLPIGAKG